MNLLFAWLALALLAISTQAGAVTCAELTAYIETASAQEQRDQAAEAKCPVNMRLICSRAVSADAALLTSLHGEYLKYCPNNEPFNPPLTGTATPAYYVLTLIYAPPGNQSQVSYGEGSTTGTKTEVTIKNQTNAVLVIETSFLRTDFEMGGGTGQGNSFETKKTAEDLIQATSQSDDLEHDEDAFYVWTNPKISLTMTTPSLGVFTIGPTTGADPVVVRLTARELKDPTLITDPITLAAVHNFKPVDYQTILKLDPFFAGSDPTKNRARFALTRKSIQVMGPDKVGGVIPGQGNKLSNEMTNSNSTSYNQDNDITVLGGYEWDTGAKLALFGGVHISTEYEHMKENSQGTIQEAQYVLQSNTAGINAAYDVYYDSSFETFAFVPVPDFTKIAFTGAIRPDMRTSEKTVTVRLKNGTTRYVPVNPATGQFKVLGSRADVASVSYDNKKIIVDHAVSRQGKIAF